MGGSRVRSRRIPVAFAALLTALVLATAGPREASARAARDPLPSWNEGPAKREIRDFVAKTTRPGSPDFVPPSNRVVVFDNDGTLWSEKPVYVQAQFVVDRVRALAPQHPEWRDKEPFASILAGRPQAALSDQRALVEAVTATHAGLTTEEFDAVVRDWIATARHPSTGRPYTEMVYQPMLEVLELLRANGFKVFVVSGGGIDFMRPWAEEVYGIPPERIVGSAIETRYESRDGKPVVARLPSIAFVDDGPGKPVGIQRHVGRRPVAAFGNSDGDLEMLEWTTSGPGPRLGVLVRHTDADREWAYDRESPVGRLDKALELAPRRGWVVVDMQRDWRRVFPPESASKRRSSPGSPAAR
ncbi:MAG: HAD family hydrolase [Alphaproteobacteria bacterium]